jgi:transcriptional regulator with XRE-family HTH domain
MDIIFFNMTTHADFGQRLAELRKVKGFSQRELAGSIGTSQRMIAHYEKHVKRPSLDKLENIAKVFGITVDELLGVKPIKKTPGAPKDAYLQRKLQKVGELPKEDQKVIVGMIDALAARKGAA